MTKQTPLISSKANPLSGNIRVPGDKSISHRALMFGLLCPEETMISGLLEGEDVLNTADAVKELGARFGEEQDGLWRIFGVGTGKLKQPQDALEMGNSGTSARLLSGLLASHPITTKIEGDASLSKRPMKRIMTPLAEMGAKFDAADGDKLPMTIYGSDSLKAIEYKTPVASAQVKSAVLLAGLNAQGTTTLIETTPTRDHTENMLRHFGVDIAIEDAGNGGQAISVKGGQTLQGCAIDVPCDPSSAAFPIVAALLIEGSEIKVPRIGINPRRTGLYDTLIEMGADITLTNKRMDAGEEVADLIVKHKGALKGIAVPPERVPSMIDEFPILAVAASCADGTTTMTNLAELRVKESDRLAKMAEGLATCGVKLEESEDGLIIHGNGKPPNGGAHITTALDHRIAMSFLVLGCVTDEPVEIDDGSAINTSFPDFMFLMNKLGTNITYADPEMTIAKV